MLCAAVSHTSDHRCGPLPLGLICLCVPLPLPRHVASSSWWAEIHFFSESL